MAKKVTKGHKIDEVELEPAEELLDAQQVSLAGVELADSDIPGEDLEEPAAEEQKGQVPATSKAITLKSGATLWSHGIDFVRGIPTIVEDDTLRAALLATGMFD